MHIYLAFHMVEAHNYPTVGDIHGERELAVTGISYNGPKPVFIYRDRPCSLDILFIQ